MLNYSKLHLGQWSKHTGSLDKIKLIFNNKISLTVNSKCNFMENNILKTYIRFSRNNAKY